MKKALNKILPIISIACILMSMFTIFTSANNVNTNPAFKTTYDYNALYMPDYITFYSSNKDDESFTIDDYTATQILDKPINATDFKNKYGTNRTSILMKRSTMPIADENIYIKHNIIERNNSQVSLRSYFIKTMDSSTTNPPTQLTNRTIVWRYQDKIISTELLVAIQRAMNNPTYKGDTNREGFIVILTGDTRNIKVNITYQYNYDTQNNITGALVSNATGIRTTYVEGMYRPDSQTTAYIIPWVVGGSEEIATANGFNGYLRITDATFAIQFVKEDTGTQTEVTPNKVFTNTQLDYDKNQSSTMMTSPRKTYDQAINSNINGLERNSWSGWLTSALRGFWEFRLLPFASVGQIISVMIGIAVVMAFLRMFHA